MAERDDRLLRLENNWSEAGAELKAVVVRAEHLETAVSESRKDLQGVRAELLDRMDRSDANLGQQIREGFAHSADSHAAILAKLSNHEERIGPLESDLKDRAASLKSRGDFLKKVAIGVIISGVSAVIGLLIRGWVS